jgi:hypothetical protein
MDNLENLSKCLSSPLTTDTWKGYRYSRRVWEWERKYLWIVSSSSRVEPSGYVTRMMAIPAIISNY